MGKENEQRFFKAADKGQGAEKGSKVKILNQEKIGEGDKANVYSVTASIRGRIRSLVLKGYKSRAWLPGTARFVARRSFKNYQAVRDAGLRTWTTYRINKRGDSILMTSGNDEDTVCVSQDPKDSEEALRPEPLRNFPEERFRALATTMYTDAKTAAAHKIMFYHKDVFLFFINRKRQTVDAFVGDFDNLDPKSEKDPKVILAANINFTRLALRSFTHHYLIPPDPYYPIIDEAGRQFI